MAELIDGINGLPRATCADIRAVAAPRYGVNHVRRTAP